MGEGPTRKTARSSPSQDTASSSSLSETATQGKDPPTEEDPQAQAFQHAFERMEDQNHKGRDGRTHDGPGQPSSDGEPDDLAKLSIYDSADEILA